MSVPRLLSRLLAPGLALPLALMAVPPAALAQRVAVADPAPLEFMGFRPGATLDDIAARVDSEAAGHLKCDRSRLDPQVTECRATLADPDLGGPVDLWLSAIDGVTGVLTLSSGVAADQLDDWRGRLERQYGRVGAKVQGTQWMMQWVRRGRMIRLTWRVQQGERTASVSLVDGHVLDAWRPARGAAMKGSQ